MPVQRRRIIGGKERALEVSMYGAINGRIAVGRHVLEIGDRCGAVVREALRAERAHIRPRPTPVLLRPRVIRGLFDRRTEVSAALSALDAGIPIEVSGQSGIGKTAILRHLAHHPRTAAFVDGIVYVPARHQSVVDLRQRLFEAFYESDEICKPTDTEIRRGLQEKQALFLLDDVQLSQDELEQVLDSAPQSAFAVATRERTLWGEVRSLALTGLPVDDAVLFLEREIERSLDDGERAAAANLCDAAGGHPLRILQATALIRERGVPVEDCGRTVAAGNLMSQLLASIDDKQRRALLALTALPGVALHVQHVSSIAEVTDVEPSLMGLVRQGLVVSGQSRHRLADGVADRLRRTEDLKPWVNRGVTYFTAWAERNRRSTEALLEESDALMLVQQCASDERRWGEVIRLGQLMEGALILGAGWGAWLIVLERCLAAAKAMGDRAVEAWALHEIGTRALCLGEPAAARAALSQSVRLRQALNDEAGVAASRHNLSLVLAVGFEPPPAHLTMPFDGPGDVSTLPLHASLLPSRDVQRSGMRVALVAMLVFAISGGIGFLATAAGLYWRSGNGVSADGALHESRTAALNAPAAGEPAPPESPPDRPATLATDTTLEPRSAEQPSAPPPVAADADRASIRIFTPRPGSIARGGATRICYAVDAATHARVEPGVGEVTPTSELSCVRVAPTRTTTYELTAIGRDAQPVKQQLVIVVM